jgi:hypothetical protein
MMQHQASRRALLQRGLLIGVGGWAALAGCSSADNPPPTANPTTTPTGRDTTTANRTLLAYFSRPGENYYYGGRRDLQVGNTEVLARMIAELIDCDVHRIDAADPYPASYDATVARNVREQEADARPAITNPLASIEPTSQGPHQLGGSERPWAQGWTAHRTAACHHRTPRISASTLSIVGLYIDRLATRRSIPKSCGWEACVLAR